MPDSQRTNSPADLASQDTGPPRPTGPLAVWVILGSSGLLVCLWLAIAVSTWSVRDAAMGRAISSVWNLSAAFCLQIERNLNGVRAAMDMMARRMRDDPTNFRLGQWAGELPILAPPTIYAAFAGPDGKLRQTTIEPAPVDVDFSDREHFRVHLDQPDAGLYLSVPMMGRIATKPVIMATRRIDDNAGHLLGVLGFALSPGSLIELHRSIDLGPRGVIALVGLDGRVRARFGYRPDGTDLMDVEQWPAILGGDATSDVIKTDSLDGIERIYAVRRLPSHPLIVVVGLSLDDELKNSRIHLAMEIAIGIAATLVLGVLKYLLTREIRRRNQREVELAREHAALEQARSEVLAEQSKLAAVNRELQVSTARAESANLAKSQFLAQMSHELRTPLHAVIGFSELIAYHVTPLPAGGQIAGYANDILKSGRHLLELINSILDLSKVESGSASLVESVVPLAEVIQDSLTTVREQALEAGVEIRAHYPDALPRIHGDTTKLRQVFINLLSNAVKFTPRGGSVTVSGRREADGAFAVAVSDTGIGMTGDEMAIAMEPFGQVENSLARTFEGTGLGLPLARRMTELHGGRLTMRSVKGAGTIVEVWLPAHRVVWPSPARGDHGTAAGLEC